MPNHKKAETKTKESIWVVKNKYSHQSKSQPPKQDDSLCYALKCNNVGKVVAKYIGVEQNIYVKKAVWFPKVSVTNMKAPNSIWGPKSRN